MPSFGSQDARAGQGRTLAGLTQPTHTIPPGCMCSWSVTRPAPGTRCVSTLTYRNALCPCTHEPKERT